MASNIKTRAYELFVANLSMIESNPTKFRRYVVDCIIEEFATPERPISLAAAASHYNIAKKQAEANGVFTAIVKPAKESSDKASKRAKRINKTEDECITIIEVVDTLVRRTESFLDESFAREKLAERRKARIPTEWHIIRGLGPNVGDTYKLASNEYDMELAVSA